MCQAQNGYSKEEMTR